MFWLRNVLKQYLLFKIFCTVETKVHLKQLPFLQQMIEIHCVTLEFPLATELNYMVPAMSFRQFDHY